MFRSEKILTIFLFFSILFCQEYSGHLKGRVLERESGKPVFFAQVFLNNTTFGTTSNDKGWFEIKNIPSGNYQITVAMLGYETETRIVEIPDKKNNQTYIYLKEKAVKLDQIEVVATEPDKWKEDFYSFKRAFVGESQFADECKIENSEKLEFYKSPLDNTLRVSSDQYITINNYALGYKVTVKIDLFIWHPEDEWMRTVNYPVFEEMVSEDQLQLDKWKKNREIAYKGSLKHFLTSLIKENYYDEGFLVEKVPKESWKYVFTPFADSHLFKCVPSYQKELIETIYIQNVHNQNIIAFDDWLMVFYLEEPEEVGYIKYKERRGVPNDKLPYQISWIKVPYSYLEFDKNGNWTDFGSNIKLSGYWGWQRLGDMLPLNYKIK